MSANGKGISKSTVVALLRVRWRMAETMDFRGGVGCEAASDSGSVVDVVVVVAVAAVMVVVADVDVDCFSGTPILTVRFAFFVGWGGVLLVVFFLNRVIEFQNSPFLLPLHLLLLLSLISVLLNLLPSNPFSISLVALPLPQLPSPSPSPFQH